MATETISKSLREAGMASRRRQRRSEQEEEPHGIEVLTA
jgi:hypothetical protein